MLNDFTLIQHKFDDGIIIYPISDVHLGAVEHCAAEWNAFCKMIQKDANKKIILAGDLINNATRSSVSNVFEETMRPMEQKKRMVEYLSPIRDRILCAVSGNHERRSGKDADDDPMYDIMSKLDLEDYYRQNAAFMKVSCGKYPHGDYKSTYTFLVTHGASEKRTESFNYVVEGLDCMVVGHTHKGKITKPERIVIDTQNNRVSMKEVPVIVAVSWLRYGGYALQKMLLPASVAKPQHIILEGKCRKNLEVRW